jgi:hypothetical protein
MGRSRFVSAVIIVLFLLAAAMTGAAQKKAKSLTVVLKDGQQKTMSIPDGSQIEFKGDTMTVTHEGRRDSIAMADVVRMEFAPFSTKSMPLGRNHFIGKWEVGEGAGRATFMVTLDADGQAHKSIGASHGTWVLVNNEARISWDDGWHDVIRKAGDSYEKAAFEPGKSLSDEPSNVTSAKRAGSESM